MNKISKGISGKDCVSFEDFIKKYKIGDYVISSQVHGTEIYEAKYPGKFIGYDALVTTKPNLSLLIKVADCVPILIYDQTRPLIAAIHAGRKGTQAGIVRKIISFIKVKYSVSPANLRAWLGPSICAKCYQIDREKNLYYDLWLNNSSQLKESGIKDIELSGVCTACSGNQQYYSFRKDQTDLRNYAFITIE